MEGGPGGEWGFVGGGGSWGTSTGTVAAKLVDTDAGAAAHVEHEAGGIVEDAAT